MKDRIVGIIGMGWVGSSVAISLLNTGAVNTLLLNDIREEVAQGEAMDLSHGSSFYPTAKIRSSPIRDLKKCDVIIITAGRGGKAEESRLDLLKDNARIIEDIAGKLDDYDGLVIVLSNPVDVLTRVFLKASNMQPEKVIGTGTMLDTVRLRDIIAQEIKIHPKSIHAQVIGEHGDSEVILWSGAQVGRMDLRKWKGWNKDKEKRIAEEVRNAAFEIISKKGSTNHAIGLVTAHLCKWILRDEGRIMCVSRYYKKYDTAISLPGIVGINGAVEIPEPEMDEQEKKAFENSVEVLRKAYNSIR